MMFPKPLTKKQIAKKTKAYHKRCWALMSEYVRRRDRGVCFTCGSRKHWKEQHAGHFFHGKLDFDPMNIHCQCAVCNTFRHGNLSEYAVRLALFYPAEDVEALYTRSFISYEKYTVMDYERIEADLKKKLGELNAIEKTEMEKIN